MKDKSSESTVINLEEEKEVKKPEEKRAQKPVQEIKKIQKPEERRIPKPEEVKRIQKPVEEVRKAQKSEEKGLQKTSEEVKRVQKSEETKKVQKLEVQKSEDEEKQAQKIRQPSPQTATKIPIPSTAPAKGSGSPSTPRQSKEKPPEKEVKNLSIEKPEKPKTPKKGPPPVKKHTVIQNASNSSEQFLSERQTTHTILTVQQHKELGIDPKELGVPTVLDSPKAKPKSVVRPMPKNPSLASALPVASILPQSKVKQEPVIPSSLRGRPNSAKVGQESGTSNLQSLKKPRSAVSRTPVSTTVKPPTSERSTRAPVESKIPKVRA